MRAFREFIVHFLEEMKKQLFAQMNNTGLLPPIPITIQYSSLNQQYQYNPNTNTIPINFSYSVLFFLTL
jgi:hypothetical protein